MSDLNFKPLIKEKLEEFIKAHPDYTVGEIIYSVVAALKSKFIKTRSDFLEMSDEDFYTGIDNALRNEENEENEENGEE